MVVRRTRQLAEGELSRAVGAAALYDFLPTAELDISDPHETSELTAIVTRMVAAIRDVEAASDACHPYEQLVLANTVDFRIRGVGAAAAWSDRQEGERRVGEMTGVQLRAALARCGLRLCGLCGLRASGRGLVSHREEATAAGGGGACKCFPDNTGPASAAVRGGAAWRRRRARSCSAAGLLLPRRRRAAEPDPAEPGRAARDGGATAAAAAAAPR